MVDSLGGERGREARVSGVVDVAGRSNASDLHQNLTDYIDKQRAGQGDAASTREWEYELSPWVSGIIFASELC